MKCILFAVAVTLTLFASQATAQRSKATPIPAEKNGRWGIFSFSDAVAEAGKKRQPIVFLILDHRNEDAAITQAAEKTYWGLEKDSTMVVVTSHLMSKAKAHMTDPAVNAISDKDLGTGFPRLVVMDQKAEVVLAKKTSVELLAMDEATVKTFAKELATANKNPGSVPAPSAAPGTPAAAPVVAGMTAINGTGAENWTNTEGKTITATIVGASADKVLLLMANGSRVEYATVNLSEASQKRVQELLTTAAK